MKKETTRKILLKKSRKWTICLAFGDPRSLTLLGRCLIFKNLGIPQLIYSALVSSTPRETSVKLNRTYLLNFIWNKKTDKIKRQILYQNYFDGGLRVTNILTTFKSLNLAWIPRLWKNENCSGESWLYILTSQFKTYNGLNFLLQRY